MTLVKVVMSAGLFVVPTFLGTVAFTRAKSQDDNFNARERNFREYVTLMRADLKAQRIDIIKQIMQFSDIDAGKFWPVFNPYDAELSKIGDGRTQLIVDYAKNYESLTDEQAGSMMTKAFDLETQRAMLKEKYFDKTQMSIGATQAAKFFLVENQMQPIIDLQISANLPVVQ